MPALRLSITRRWGTPPKCSSAWRCSRSHVAIVWSKTNSAYWYRLHERVITNTHVRRATPVVPVKLKSAE